MIKQIIILLLITTSFYAKAQTYVYGRQTPGGTSSYARLIASDIPSLNYQLPLVSGTNIKTINSVTLLGSGNLSVQDVLVSGTNIKTINSTTILGSGNFDLVDLISDQTIAGKKTLTAGSTFAALNIGTVSAPISTLLSDGDIFINNTALHLGWRVGGTITYAMRTSAANTASLIPYVSANNSSLYTHSSNFAFNGSQLTVVGNTQITLNNASTVPIGIGVGGTFSVANANYGINVTGTPAIRATANDAISVFNQGLTVTTGATGQSVTTYKNSVGITASHTGASVVGFLHNPTISGTFASSVTNTAFAANSGQFVMGSLTPTAGALMDLQSTTMAFSPPKMSTTQRNAIASTFDGQYVHNLTTHQLEFFNGTSWGPVSVGTIGGSTGSTDRRIVIANGTGGSTIQTAGIGIDASNNIIDANGNELIKFTSTASAVNEVTIVNQTTGNPARIEASGGDTNASLLFQGKGTGGVSIKGFTDGSTATSGQIGEEVISTVSSFTNYTTSATYQNITSITLSAGDWDLSAFYTFNASTASLSPSANAIFLISTTTASALGTTEGLNIAYVPEASLLSNSKFSGSISPYRVSISSSTTYYLNSQSTFSTNNPQFAGTIRARRIR